MAKRKQEIAQATPAQQVGPVLKVKTGVKYRGARDAWYQLLCKYDGKPLAEFTAAATAAPPSLPTKGKGAGAPEPVAGWVNFFVRQGVIQG